MLPCDGHFVQASMSYDHSNRLVDPDLEALRASHEYNLQQTLFHDYDTSVRPRYNSSQTVNVSVRFSLQQIYDLVREIVLS